MGRAWCLKAIFDPWSLKGISDPRNIHACFFDPRTTMVGKMYHYLTSLWVIFISEENFLIGFLEGFQMAHQFHSKMFTIWIHKMNTAIIPAIFCCTAGLFRIFCTNIAHFRENVLSPCLAMFPPENLKLNGAAGFHSPVCSTILDDRSPVTVYLLSHTSADFNVKTGNECLWKLIIFRSYYHHHDFPRSGLCVTRLPFQFCVWWKKHFSSILRSRRFPLQ